MWYFFLIYVRIDPSGKPIKFRVKAIGPTVVKASWKPPAGRTVFLYVISYRKASDPERLNKEVKIEAEYYKEVDNEYNHEIRGLHPLTSYLFTIRGDSAADLDTEKGDPTLPLSLLTPSEKEWKCTFDINCPEWLSVKSNFNHMHFEVTAFV